MPIIFNRKKILEPNKITLYTTKQIDSHSDIKLNPDFENTKLAANQNNLEAVYRLANMYYTGCPIKRNLNEAARLFRVAAELGMTDAEEVLMGMVNNIYDSSHFPILYHAAANPFSIIRNNSIIRQFNRWVRHYPKQFIFMLQENPDDSYLRIRNLLTPDLRNKMDDIYEDFVMRVFLQLEGVFDCSISKVMLEYLFDEYTFQKLENNLNPLVVLAEDLPLPIHDGVAKGDASIVRYLNQAAMDGNVDAQVQLGDYFTNLPIQKRDLKEAFYWYRKSALAGYELAQMKLANCYEENKGVKNGLKESIYWYRVAAEQNNPFAREKLLQLYHDKNLSVISPALIFHAALLFQGAEMLNDFVDLFRTKPMEIMLLLQESKEGSYRQIKDLFNTQDQGLLDKILLMFVVQISMMMGMKLENNSLKLVFSFLYPPSMTDIIFKNIKPIFYKSLHTSEDLYQLSLQSKDFMVQLRLMYLSAVEGDVRAQALLGKFYLRGVMVDREAGIYWLKRAILQGNKEASAQLDDLIYEMTPQNKRVCTFEYMVHKQNIEEKKESIHLHEKSNEEIAAWCRLGLEENYGSALLQLKTLYENNKNDVGVVYHAALAIKREDMVADLNRLATTYPEKIVELLRKNPNDILRMKDFLAPGIAGSIQHKLYQSLTPKKDNLLNRFFNRIFPKRSQYEIEMTKMKSEMKRL